MEAGPATAKVASRHRTEEITMNRITAALACLALLVVAAPAAAAKPKPLYYDGETQAGESLSLTLQGKRVSDVHGLILTTCVPTHGTPVSYAVPFDPPGSFVLGAAARKAVTVENMPYRGDVAKNFTVQVSRRSRHIWRADLSVNFSYEEVNFGTFGELEQRFFICQGDDEFLFRV
jgi:hypothetical protein